MRRLFAFMGLIGTAVFVVLSILDHIIHLGSNFYFIILLISGILMLPMLIREAMIVLEHYEAKNSGGDK